MPALEPWLEGPLVRLVDEAAARLALVTTAAGQVIAQHGFARSVDVMSASALGAGIVASTEALAQLIGAGRFGTLAHQGARQGVVLCPFATPRGRWVVLVVFGRESSVGLVQLCLDTFVAAVREGMPPEPERPPLRAETFELELNRSLRALFGR